MKFKNKISVVLCISILISLFAFSGQINAAPGNTKSLASTSTKSFTMILGESSSIKFVVYGSGSAKNTVSKTSNNKVVAIVGKAKGSTVKFKAKKVGTATLTAKNGRNTLKYKINVVKKDLWSNKKVSLGKGMYIENAKLSLYRSYGSIGYRLTGVAYNSNPYPISSMAIGATAKKGNVNLTNLYSAFIADIPANGRYAVKYEQSLYVSLISASRLATSSAFELKYLYPKTGVGVVPEDMTCPQISNIFDPYGSVLESATVTKFTELTYGSFTYKFSGVWNKTSDARLEFFFRLYDASGKLLNVTSKYIAGSYTTGSQNYNVSVSGITSKVARVEAVTQTW